MASIDAVVREARKRLNRLEPQQAADAQRRGALLVDTRPLEQRQRDGEIPGAMVIDRNVLEWRLDPASPDRVQQMTDRDQSVVIICNEGYSSSLAAAMLQRLGLRNATDVIGGFQAWATCGMPVERGDRATPEMLSATGLRRPHWDARYAGGSPTALSWYQAIPAVSLQLLETLGIAPPAAVIDIGGGASSVVDSLLARGYDDVTVLDISRVALDLARQRCSDARGVHWLCEDVLRWEPARQYDVWHDRAVFHFLVEPADREAYVRALRSALRPGGRAIIATFASDGPERCSGLPVSRYDAGGLARELGPDFDIVETRREEHTTPAGAVQPFTWVAATQCS